MRIYPSDIVPGQVSHNRPNETSSAHVAGGDRSAPQSAEDGHPVPEIRKQLLVVQRALGRFQSMLGGLEGFKVLLDSEARTAADYIRHVVYRGETVLEPYSDKLSSILQNKDRQSLQRMIDGTREEIHGLAVELSRLETAEQNSRSLAFSQSALSNLLQGIRSQGDELLNLEGKNVLDLLG